MKLLVKSRPTRRIYNLPLTCTRNLHNKPRRLRKNHHYLNLLVKKQTKQQQQQTPRVFVIAIDISKCRDWYGTVSRYWCAHPSKWKIKERKKKRNHVSLHDFAESQQVLLADFLSLSFFFFPKCWVCDWFFLLCSYQHAINHETNPPNFSEPGLHRAETNKVKQAKRNTCLSGFYVARVLGFLSLLFFCLSISEDKRTVQCAMWCAVMLCCAASDCEWRLTCLRVWDDHALGHAGTEKDEGGTAGGGRAAAGTRLWAADKWL